MTLKIKPIKLLKRAPATISTDQGDMEQEAEQKSRAASARRNIFWALFATAMVFIIFPQPVLAADTIWTKFSDVMKDIYGKLLGISTIIAVTAATIALLVRMISRNQRAVDEASTWLKRITITWIILNTLGFIIAYLQPWFAGGQYTP